MLSKSVKSSSRLRVFPTCLWSVLLSILVGFLLLLAVFHIPVRFMQEECRESVRIFQEEDRYPNDPYSGRRLDNYTDSIFLLGAAYPGEESILDRTIHVYTQRTVDVPSPVRSFISIYSKESEEVQPTEYAWYWHGYLLTLKPLLTMLNYQQIRHLNLAVQYTLLLVLLFLIQRRLPSVLLPFLLTVLFLAPTAIGRVLGYSSVYYILLLFLLLLLWNPKGRITEENVWLLFLFAGILTGYFDNLSAPTQTLTFPLCFLLVQRAGHGSWKQNARLFLRCCFVWGFGYAGMWGAKWVLVLLFEGREFLISLGNQMWLYTGPSIGGHIVTQADALRRNFGILFKDPDLIIRSLILAAVLLVLVLRDRSRINRRSLADALLVLFITLIPLMWTLFLKNHSYRHYWFAYRTLTPLILCPLCALTVLRGAPPIADAQDL